LYPGSGHHNTKLGTTKQASYAPKNGLSVIFQ